MTSETRKQIQDTLPNISESKDNQATKFGQSIKHGMINIFLQR